MVPTDHTNPLPERLTLSWSRWFMAIPTVGVVFLLSLSVTTALNSRSPWSGLAWGGSVLLLAVLAYLAFRIVNPPVALVVDEAGLQIRRPWLGTVTEVAWDDITRAEVVHVFRRGHGMKLHLTAAARARITGHKAAPVTPFDGPDLDVPMNDIGLTPQEVAQVFLHYGGIKVRLSIMA